MEGTSKRRVMIVEDQRDMEDFYREIFSTMGFEVVAVARDGKSAVETYFSLDPHPDLVIMDHRLPGISGLQAAQSILERDPKAPIVIVTADEEGLWESTMRGVPAIKKPAVFEKIIKAVMRSVPGAPSSVSGPVGETPLADIFQPHHMYLVPEESPEVGMKTFLHLLSYGYKGLLFTRRNPEELKRAYPLEGVPLVWFSTIPSEMYETVTPFRIQHLLLLLQESLRNPHPTVAYMEGFEFFITNIPFDRILNIIQVLRDRVTRSENMLLIMSMDPDVIEPRQYKILKKEFEVVEPERIIKALEKRE